MIAVLVFAAVMFIMLPSAASSAAPTDNVLFITEDGSSNTCPAAEEISAGGTVLTLTQFGPTSGWYIVTADAAFTGTVAVGGDVYLIIADNCRLTVPSGGILIPSGSSLTIYAQTLKDADKGKLVSADKCINIDGGSLTNAAAIEGVNAVHISGGGTVHNYGTINGSSAGNAILADTTATVSITNHENGLIQGKYGIRMKAAVGSTIDNYGSIIGITSSDGVAVSIMTDATITNHEGGLMQSTQTCVAINGTGTVYNSGRIIVATNSAFSIPLGIAAGKTALIVNNETGIIECNNSFATIRLFGGGTIINSGIIRATEGSAYTAIYAVATTDVINNAGGLIESTHFTIMFCNNGTVDNYGEIISRGTGTQSYGILTLGDDTSKPTDPTTVINREGGIINGSYIGLRLSAGGEIYNYGTIEGSLYGVYTDCSGAPLTFVNGGAIKSGVGLSGNAKKDDADPSKTILPDANDVTLMAGSVIGGRFGIGDNAGSKLTFAGDLGSSLRYAVVGGNSNIGCAAVHIDPAGLPAGLRVGDVLVLIDGSAGTMSGSPANTELSVGGYVFELKVEGNKLIAVVLETEQTTEPPIEPPTDPNAPHSKDYFITATGDAGAKISPDGKVKVGGGGSRRFDFSAAEGYLISAVFVDGVALSQEDIEKGSYTFLNVQANHTIKATSKTSTISLIINVTKGKGHAEYCVNGGPFMVYTSPVSLPDDCSLIVVAYADDGYGFKEWRHGAKTYTDPEIGFADIMTHLFLELIFEGEGGSIGTESGPGHDSPPSWIIALVVLLIAVLLWLVFGRRNYDVIKVETSAAIIGADRVRRKSAYHFLIEGTGAVSYRIGDARAWKTLSPDADGKYTIPRGEINDTVTIECA